MPQLHSFKYLFILCITILDFVWITHCDLTPLPCHKKGFSQVSKYVQRLINLEVLCPFSELDNDITVFHSRFIWIKLHIWMILLNRTKTTLNDFSWTMTLFSFQHVFEFCLPHDLVGKYFSIFFICSFHLWRISNKIWCSPA